MGRIINPNIFGVKIDSSGIGKKELKNSTISSTPSKFEEILREKSELKFSAQHKRDFKVEIFS